MARAVAQVRSRSQRRAAASRLLATINKSSACTRTAEGTGRGSARSASWPRQGPQQGDRLPRSGPPDQTGAAWLLSYSRKRQAPELPDWLGGLATSGGARISRGSSPLARRDLRSFQQACDSLLRHPGHRRPWVSYALPSSFAFARPAALEALLLPRRGWLPLALCWCYRPSDIVRPWGVRLCRPQKIGEESWLRAPSCSILG